MKIKECKLIHSVYIGNETFVIDVERGREFGVDRNKKYLIIHEDDFIATKAFMDKICKPETHKVLETLGII